MARDQRTPIASHRMTIDYTYSVFRLCGTWKWKTKNPIVNVCNFLIRSINWITVISVQLTLTVDMFQKLPNIEAVSDVVGFLAPLSMTIMKSIKLHTLQKRIHELIESVHKPIELLKYSSDIGILTIIRKAVYYQNFELALFASILSIVSCAVFLMSSEGSDTGLSLERCYLFDEKNPVALKIVLFIKFWTILMGCIWVALFDLLVLGLIRWINVQIKILHSNYRNCEPGTAERDSYVMTDDTYAQIENYDYFKVTEKQYEINVFVPFGADEMDVVEDSFVLRLKTCIKHHQRILYCIDNFNDTFSQALCFQVLITNAVTCFYLYQAFWAIKHNKSVIKCIVLFFSVTTELLYYCIFGTLLTIQGEALRESQYNVPWHNYLNRKVGDLLINALIQSIKPLEMRAGYFFIFSVETFVSVLQKASSFFVILNTMMD